MLFYCSKRGGCLDSKKAAHGKKVYYQIAASILDPVTFAREIAPLKRVNDHYPKFIISMDELPMGDEGIKQVNVVDFLLGT